MKINSKVNIHNRFDIHIDNIKTGEHKEITAYNIVLDSMWERLCAGSSYFNYIHFGVGTGTPTPERVSLFSHLGTKSAENVELFKELPTSHWKRRVVLNAEEYVGETITEVGIAMSTSPSDLVTHATLKDAEGNPISISKSNTDVVTIYATVFITLAANPNNEVRYIGIPNDNLLLNYLVGGSAFNSSTFRLGKGKQFSNAGVGSPKLGETAAVSLTSDVVNKKRLVPVTRFGITEGNGNISELDFKNVMRVQLPSPGIFSGQPYTDVAIGAGDGVETEFELPSENVRAGSLEVKVDGVTVSHTQQNYEVYEPNYAIGIPSEMSNLDTGSYSRFIHTKSLNYCVYSRWDGDGVVVISGFGTENMKKEFEINTPSQVQMLDASYDAETIVIGVGGKLKVYDRIDGEYIQQRPEHTLLESVSQGVAVSDDGNTIAYGSIYDTYEILDWVVDAWVARPKPSPTAGGHARDVSLSGDGNIFAIISESSPHGAVYDWDGSSWTKRVSPPSIGFQYPQKINISDDGLILSVTAGSSSGYNFAVYDWNGTAWVRRAPSVAHNSVSSASANVSPDFTLAIMTHSAYFEIYKWDGSDWNEVPNNVIAVGDNESIGFKRDNSVLLIPLSPSPIVFMGTQKTKAVMTSAPASNAAITADYIVDGVHKTDQYVIDVSFSIQFAEGV